MRILSFLFFMFFYGVASAQGCEDSIMKMQGSWKKRADANMKTAVALSPAQVQQLQAGIDRMQQLLQAAYPKPKGAEAGWYRTMSYYPLVKEGPAPYELNAL